jgi:ABC-2 type transport system ATP-binding protein
VIHTETNPQEAESLKAPPYHGLTATFEVQRLEKRYQGFTLGPVDLRLQPGTVLALIGPNGAGKTTLLDCLAGLIRPDAGSIRIFGQRADGTASAKGHIGYASDEGAYYENWSGARNLRFLSKFYPNWSEDWLQELVKRFDFPLEKPKLLLLDEPTSGLDPLARAEVLEVLWELLEGEQAILYSSHILSDISRLADELAFIKGGRIVLNEPKDTLEDKWRKVSFRLAAPLPQTLTASFASHRAHGNEHHAISRDFALTQSQLSALGAERVEVNRLSIDDIAVHILKRESRDVYR